MKYSLIALTLAAAASAQSVSACDGKAQKCIDDATTSSSDCSLGDWYCGCQADTMSKIQGAATSCVIEACGGASGALAVISEVQAICEKALANPPSTEEPEPTTSETPEEPKPTETETPEEPSASGSAEPSATKPPTSCGKCNGTTPEQPQPTGEEPPEESFPTAGAGALAPVAALALGLFAFAL
ncbi:hypothetical protein jhhlp_002833 [Lomentospora prolificans]|uniref:CFEM domain-containing protein n=1 Tax=Lomentospora prolificans TaxID=41688 RepID=A0A2N3NFC9_9PEZI|nr:hypothetical protein jhhlp_002833 [Lomentospora prolificans]